MISDNDLLLYYYRDGLDAAERARIAAALSEQPELAARLHRLVARLDAAAATPEAPVPEHVQRRWQAALERAARSDASAERKPRSRVSPHLHWGIAAAACALVVLVVAVQIGMQSTPERILERPPVAPTSGATGAGDASAYQRGLRVHLENAEWQLASLESASGDERARLIETLIAQNRLYAVAAERAGEPQLARVLRAFTPILERLADEGGGDSEDEIAQLTFELQVLQARLTAAPANESNAQSLAL